MEVGAGSGALTAQLILKLGPQDTLDVVEKDPNFCRVLRKKFGHLPNVSIHEVSIVDFVAKPFDGLLSSLPLNAFGAPLVGKILKQYENLVKKGGILSYYEYMGFEKVKKVFLMGDKADDFHKGQELKNQFVSQYSNAVEIIWWNIPPARVVHCKL